MVDLGGNKIGLHCGYHNRFITMDYHGMIRSSQFNWDQLPATGYDWERFTVVYVGAARGPERYTPIVGKKCKGHPYTHDLCQPGSCDGWQGLTEAQCWEKCEYGQKPAGCTQQQHCVAAVWYANTAWCHLYAVCTDYWDEAGATILKRVESPFLLQMEAVTEEPELEDLNDLAVAIPLAIINVSNFSGLISSKNFSHMGMKHKFGDFSQDVALLQGSLANLFVNATCVSF